MRETLASIRLGDDHFYFLSDVMSINLDDYNSWSTEDRNLICTAISKFGEYPPSGLISETNGRRWFYGRMKFTSNESKRQMPKGKQIIKLTDNVRYLFAPIRSICDVLHNGPSCFVTHELRHSNNEDLKTFKTYIEMTR